MESRTTLENSIIASPTSAGQEMRSLQLFLARLGSLWVPCRPGWQLLTGNRCEPGIATEDLVHEACDACLITLDLTILTMIKLCESKTLVGVEDDTRGQLRRREEILEGSLDPC